MDSRPTRFRYSITGLLLLMLLFALLARIALDQQKLADLERRLEFRSRIETQERVVDDLKAQLVALLQSNDSTQDGVSLTPKFESESERLLKGLDPFRSTYEPFGVHRLRSQIRLVRGKLKVETAQLDAMKTKLQVYSQLNPD